MSETSRIVVATGARAAERRLLDEIGRALPADEIAAPPLVVVVPSRALRAHLLGRLAALRPAWLGLEVVTLAAAEAAILARTGGAPASGTVLEPLLASRLAARESPLARALGGLVDGYAAIAAAINDLLDAGFVEEHAEALEERLEAERRTAGHAPVERAQAIVRVAAGVRAELAGLGLAPAADLRAEAARRAAADPARALPARRVFVHGFADATGIATDLLAAIVRWRPTTVVLDSPAAFDGAPASWRFGRRLRERLAGIARLEDDLETLSPPAVAAYRAADPAREARAAIRWLAAEAVDPPEAAALVARDLGDLAAWVRELDRQAVAGSASAGLPLPASRRAAGLSELLSLGSETPLGVVLSIASEALEAASGASVADLRLAFAALTARTLGRAAELAVDSGGLRLPVSDRWQTTDGRGARAQPRELDRSALEGAVVFLAALRAELAALSAPSTIGHRLGAVRQLVLRTLPIAAADELLGLLEPLATPALAHFVVDAEEWRRLVAESWSAVPGERVGRGGGLALLSVTEARGLTFERLALAGLSRSRFPRPVRPDALLPDALRLRLRELLPDLPVKAEGHDEERYLFAQLLGAAPQVALFRPLSDGRGAAAAASPLAEELLRARGVDEAPAPAATAPSPLGLATAHALAQDHDQLARTLPLAVAEARERFGDRRSIPADRVAAARLALLAERTADPASPAAGHLGAFLGLVGEPSHADPRHGTLSVTALERLAGCGWQFFLERVLALAPLPELVETLPALPRAVVGSVVHAVLESILRETRRIPLAEAIERQPVTTVWPGAEELARRTRELARSALAEEALDPALFLTPLLRAALAHLEIARATDWPDGRRDLLAVEVRGEAAVAAAGADRVVTFRADRLGLAAEGLELTDYKTGKPVIQVVREKERRQHLARKIAGGETLQLPVYLLGAGERAASARYLSLHPDERWEPMRVTAITLDDVDRSALTATFDALYAAWDAGVLPPRLVDAKLATYAGCAWCEVRDACVYGESGARLRFERWATASPDRDQEPERVARAWFELRGSPARANEAES